MPNKKIKIVVQGPKKYFEVYTIYKDGKKDYLETTEEERVSSIRQAAVNDRKIKFIDIELVDIDSANKVKRTTYFQLLNQARRR